MPDVGQLFSLGAGNGFPFCIQKVDVSDYLHWITLGGFSSDDDASSMNLARDRESALKLFRSLYEFQLDATADDDVDSTFEGDSGTTTGSQGEVAVYETEYGYAFDDFGEAPTATPIARECYPAVGAVRTVEDEEGESSINIETTVDISITAMYVGSIDDEANFVGLGLLDDAFTVKANNADPTLASIKLRSFTNQESFGLRTIGDGTPVSSGYEEIQAVEKVTIEDDIHLYGIAYASAVYYDNDAQSSDYTLEVSSSGVDSSAVGMRAYVTGTDSTVISASDPEAEDDSINVTATMEVEITGFDFYNYV